MGMSNELRGNVEVNTRVLVADYLQYHIQKHKLTWQPADNREPRTPGVVEITMRALGDEFEERYRDVFLEMSNQLDITRDTAEQTFLGVVNELFSDGTNWGRIVALFAFGATLAVECVKKDMPEIVDQLIGWIAQYVDNCLHPWIKDHDGWKGFLDFYEGGPEQRNESPWPSIKKICGYAVGALGVLTLGAILSQKS